MNRSPIRVVRHPDHHELVLDRVDKANAMNARMMREVAEFAAGPSVAEAGVLLLSSASPALFCAGADIAEFVAGPEALAEQEEALLAMIEALACCPAPLIAVARGRAAGAGAILLALADVVIAADDLQLACPEIRFGMYPVIVDAVLQARMLPALSQRLCLGGEAIGAVEAFRVGLVTEVLPATDFASAARIRLAWYLGCRAALGIARRSRLLTQSPQALVARVKAVAPLMQENFGRPGVVERIASYLEGLRSSGTRARNG